jgi:hypothetical protein
MPTFFAALHTKRQILPSLMVSATVIIDDADIVGADLQRARAGEMKKIDNHVDTLNTQ